MFHNQLGKLLAIHEFNTQPFFFKVLFSSLFSIVANRTRLDHHP